MLTHEVLVLYDGPFSPQSQKRLAVATLLSIYLIQSHINTKLNVIEQKKQCFP